MALAARGTQAAPTLRCVAGSLVELRPRPGARPYGPTALLLVSMLVPVQAHALLACTLATASSYVGQAAAAERGVSHEARAEALPPAATVLASAARANWFWQSNSSSPQPGAFGDRCSLGADPRQPHSFQRNCIEGCGWTMGTYTVGLMEYYQAPNNPATANTTIDFLRAQAGYNCDCPYGGKNCQCQGRKAYAVCFFQPSGSSRGDTAHEGAPRLGRGLGDHDADNQVCTSSYIELHLLRSMSPLCLSLPSPPPPSVCARSHLKSYVSDHSMISIVPKTTDCIN